MEHGGERRYGGHEAAQRAPARPMRGAVALPPAPPKVYRVEPRDFRELVQRLTGARAASASTTATGPASMVAQAHAAQAHGRMEAAAADQFDYSSWFSAPLLSPASMPAGSMDGHHHGSLL